MTQTAARRPRHVAEVVQTYGHCLDLIGMDPHFHNVTVGLYVKENVATVWTFSQIPGVDDRIRQIRDLFVERGGMEPIPGTHNQARFACGNIHERPLKFLLRNAVERSFDPFGQEPRIAVKDIKSGLTMIATPEEQDGRWIYRVSAEGDFAKPEIRIRALVGGFMRYGEMERVAPDEAAFSCGRRHDGLVRLLMPHARNVSGVETELELEALRGQMTTQTLGFSQT